MQANPALQPAPERSNRARLVAGLVSAIEEKGYPASTVSDVVRHARVSKRTFYEEFSDKEACFLAAYSALTDEVLEQIERAVDPSASLEFQVRAAVGAYLRALRLRPAVTRTFLLEIYSAGATVLERRREVHQRFAELLRRLVQRARRANPELRPLAPAMATAIVGGINELVLLEVEKGRVDRLGELAGTASALVRAVLVER